MRIKHLKSNMKQHETKPVLCDYEVKTYLEPLRRFANVTIDKSADNYAFNMLKVFIPIVFLLKLEYLVILTPKRFRK